MKKIYFGFLLCLFSVPVFAGNLLGLDISARWFNASSGKYTESLSTAPASAIHGAFPASIYEAMIRLPVLGPIGADIKARYGTVSRQTMYLDNMPGSGNMSTTIDATLFGATVNPGFSLGLGPVRADIFGSVQYVYTRKNFYDWTSGGTIVAAGDKAGRFLMS
ncbi:MAG: hypothetical protein WCI43_00160 [Candidatus Firestonebacteria bacterium]